MPALKPEDCDRLFEYYFNAGDLGHLVMLYEDGCCLVRSDGGVATGHAAIRAVFDAGLSVPDDIAIIGIDDIEEGRYSRPSLSTVSLDTPFIAHHAVARIVARIDDPDVAAEEVVAPHQLVVRESTGVISSS